MPLVLTQNLGYSIPDFSYADIEGERYQYPNIYRNRIRPGRRFIYYRGSRDVDGRKRTPDYFGHGMISDVVRESPEGTPGHQTLWIASIDSYEKFDAPVPFTTDSGQYLEPRGDEPAYWRQGVREIDETTYAKIIELGLVGRSPTKPANEQDQAVLIPDGFSPLSEIIAGSKGSAGSSGSGQRRYAAPKNTKWVGDLAEHTVFEYLKRTEGTSQVTWLERDGLRPGWDIEYVDESGETIRVEVKGTTLAQMASCELTANEWKQAQAYGNKYQLYLVTGVGKGKTPKISKLVDPAGIVSSNPTALQPTSYSLTLSGALD